jgi:hypothetical protein
MGLLGDAICVDTIAFGNFGNRSPFGPFPHFNGPKAENPPNFPAFRGVGIVEKRRSMTDYIRGAYLFLTGELSIPFFLINFPSLFGHLGKVQLSTYS